MILLLFFLLLLLLENNVSAIQCLTMNGYETSASDKLCGECQLLGYLDENSECVYTVTESAPVQIIDETIVDPTTNCESPTIEEVYCEAEPTGECTLCVFGVRASSCNGRGYLVRSTTDYGKFECVCYSSRLDPRRACTRPLIDTLPLYSNLSIEGQTETKIYCEAFNSLRYGCYKPVDSSGHKYGTSNPPIPTSCCHENIGPPPGALKENLLSEKLPESYAECNEYGGIPRDVEFIPVNATAQSLNLTEEQVVTRAFQTCHGKGDWNTTSRQCECYPGWKLATVGEYPPGTAIQSCVECSPLYGPDVLDPDERPPFCSKIYTPNPVTGTLEECGGKGTYINGNCDCFGNTTHGFWSLVNITSGGVTVETCGVCTSYCL